MPGLSAAKCTADLPVPQSGMVAPVLPGRAWRCGEKVTESSL